MIVGTSNPNKEITLQEALVLTKGLCHGEDASTKLNIRDPYGTTSLCIMEFFGK